MDFAMLATCLALTGASHPGSAQEQTACAEVVAAYHQALRSLQLSAMDRDAITRVAYAEAAGQGDAGLAGVVYTILNRLVSGQFGDSLTEILNAHNQFEPVTRHGGWQYLPPRSPAERARIDTILNLALDGRLPDPTGAALFFQNPVVVAAREQRGQVSPGLTHFGGAQPSAVIRDHAFYPSTRPGMLTKQPALPARRNEVGEDEPTMAQGVEQHADGGHIRPAAADRLNVFRKSTSSLSVFAVRRP